MTSDSVIVGHI